MSLIGWRLAFAALTSGRLSHPTNPRLMRMQSRHQCRPGRATSPGIVELRKPHSTSGKTVNIWRINLAAVISQIGETHVIHHDQNHIGSLCSFCGD